MRLWHQNLITKLPRQQLLGQHRELCALRGLGWNKKHSTINYIFNYPYSYLFFFHMLIIKEMKQRGYKVNNQWENICYRGQKLGLDTSNFTKCITPKNKIIYKEHNNTYLQVCLDNLKRKGIIINTSNKKRY